VQERETQQEEQPAPPPVRFHVIVLDNLRSAGCATHEEAVAINARGETVGSICLEGTARAAYWSAEGELRLLVDKQSKGDSFALDINDAGVAIGYTAQGSSRSAFRWSIEAGRVELDFPAGAVPLAVDLESMIAFSFPAERAVLSATWHEGADTTPLSGLKGDVLVRDVNRSGSLTGIVGGGALPARAFLQRKGGALLDLGVAPGFGHSHGNGVNDEDVVVGLCRSDSRQQATRWSGDSGPVLLPFAREDDTHSAAFAVNAQGWTVGVEHGQPDSHERSTAVLWIGEVAYELGPLLIQPQQGGPIEVRVAWDVNDQGQIAARGLVAGQERALRLDPR